MVRRTLLPCLLLCALVLPGCVEAEESWELDRKGGGTYALVVRWNADLWRRVGDILGAKVMARIAGPGFPLRPELWRDGLKDLPGVTIGDVGERDTDTGLRELHVALTFKRMEDLLGWEVLAGRRVTIEAEQPEKGASTKPLRATLTMEPIARVPVLDRIAALVEAAEKPPAKAEGAAAERDPPPLARMGLERTAAEMIWKLVRLPLGEVKLQSRVRVPGELVSKQGTPVDKETREATYTWSFADLRRVDADRTIRLRWRILSFDESPALDHPGQRDPRPRAPDGSKK